MVLSFAFTIRFLGGESFKADLQVSIEKCESIPSIEFFQKKNGYKEMESLCSFSIAPLAPHEIHQVFSPLFVKLC